MMGRRSRGWAHWVLLALWRGQEIGRGIRDLVWPRRPQKVDVRRVSALISGYRVEPR